MPSEKLPRKGCLCRGIVTLRTHGHRGLPRLATAEPATRASTTELVILDEPRTLRLFDSWLNTFGILCYTTPHHSPKAFTTQLSPHPCVSPSVASTSTRPCAIATGFHHTLRDAARTVCRAASG